MSLDGLPPPRLLDLLDEVLDLGPLVRLDDLLEEAVLRGVVERDLLVAAGPLLALPARLPRPASMGEYSSRNYFLIKGSLQSLVFCYTFRKIRGWSDPSVKRALK